MGCWFSFPPSQVQLISKAGGETAACVRASLVVFVLNPVGTFSWGLTFLETGFASHLQCLRALLYCIPLRQSSRMYDCLDLQTTIIRVFLVFGAFW